MKSVIAITNISTQESVQLYTVPMTLVSDPKPIWANIKTPGRNNVFPQFTGAESEIKFTIDWYSRETSREDVIRNCRKLESWSLNDGYNGGVPLVHLHWGGLFRYTEWVISSAGYELSMFEPGNNMLPTQAFQDIVLTRANTENVNRSFISTTQ